MGKITYKIILIIICLMQINPVFAVDACVPNDTKAIILNPNKMGTNYWDSTEWSAPKSGVFKIQFDKNYYSYGLGAFVSDNYVLSNNGAELYDNGVRVVGGEKNGNNCFCKLFYPVVSAWILHPTKRGGYDWLDQRGYGCDGYCSYSIRYADPVSFKAQLYSSITN